MRHLLVFSAVMALMISSFNASAQKIKEKESKMKTKGKGPSPTDMNMPYKATYSSQFEMGNPALSAKVLKAWKDYEINKLEDSRDLLADTVWAYLPDGTELKGRDAFMNALNSYRGSFHDVKLTVAAWLATRSKDLNKETVLVWGTETGTKPDGTKQSMVLHEVWFFNKDGKVDGFRQFTQLMPQQ